MMKLLTFALAARNLKTGDVLSTNNDNVSEKYFVEPFGVEIDEQGRIASIEVDPSNGFDTVLITPSLTDKNRWNVEGNPNRNLELFKVHE